MLLALGLDALPPHVDVVHPMASAPPPRMAQNNLRRMVHESEYACLQPLTVMGLTINTFTKTSRIQVCTDMERWDPNGMSWAEYRKYRHSV